MTCHFCRLPITDADRLNIHHVVYRSNGGTDADTAPSHESCHKAHHMNADDFRRWGRQGGIKTAATRRWTLNLKNVNRHPAYAADRARFAASAC